MLSVNKIFRDPDPPPEQRTGSARITPSASAHASRLSDLLIPANKNGKASGQTASSSMSSPSTSRPSLGTNVLKVISAPAVLAGTGSTIVIISDFWPGALAMGLFTILSAKNELNSIPSAPNSLQSKECQQGLKAFLRERLGRPGFCVWMQGWTYLATTLSCLMEGKILKSACFAAFSIGEWACSRLADLSATLPIRKEMRIETKLKGLWTELPQNLKTVLLDPGSAFPTGNLALIYATARESNLSISQFLHERFNSPASLVLFAVGAGIASVAAARGISPLFTTKRVKPSAFAPIVGGAGDVLLGVASCLAGMPYVGAATIFWGISNLRYGLIVDPNFLKKIFRN